MADSKETILWLEDDEDIAESFGAGLPLALTKEGLDAELRVFDRVDPLQAAIQRGAMQVLCLVSDLSGVGLGNNPVSAILHLVHEERMNCPVLICTGLPLHLLIAEHLRNELEGEGTYF